MVSINRWSIDNHSREKLLVKFSSFFLLGQSHLRVFMVLFFYRFTLFAVLLEGIRVYSRGIVGFTEQWTAFMRAQSAILQSRDFIWRVERALKITYPRS